jgi:hypothetical protein
MKKFYGILFLLALMAFKTNVQAQVCQGVGSGMFSTDPNSLYSGVFVTLDRPYGQAVTVSGNIKSSDPTVAPVGFSLDIAPGNLRAETIPSYYETTPGDYAYADITSVTPCPPADVSVNGNHLKFISIATYEQYANNELDRSILTNLATANSGVTTLEELNNAQDTLYPDFLKQILNTDEIVEAGSFLIKVDLENHRALVISSNDPNAYQILSYNQLTANGLMNFSDNVGNTIEILQAIESGQLSISNYQLSIELEATAKLNRTRLNNETESLAFYSPLNYRSVHGPLVEDILKNQLAPTICIHATRHKQQHPHDVWKTVSNQNSGCPDNVMVYAVDNKIVYQNFIIFFSLEAKTKSMQAGTCTNWIFVPSYTADLMLSGSVRYAKRCGPEQVASKTTNTYGNVLNWRPYESSRSLSKYDFTMEFGVRDVNSVGNYFPGLGATYRITSGY